MTTIEEVIAMWDKQNPENKIAEGKKGKIIPIKMYGQISKEAVIRLSDFPFEPWHERTCYVFSFVFKGQTEEIETIDIYFQRRISSEATNTSGLYEFLNKELNGKKIKNKTPILSKGRINRNHLLLKLKFPPDSSEQDICDGMRELIELTQEKIRTFLKNDVSDKSNNENDNQQEQTSDKVEKNNSDIKLTENQNSEFRKIMKKYDIEEDKEIYYKCRRVYIKTIDIKKELFIDEAILKKLKVSHYTKKSIADKLFIASREENKCDEFRLSHTKEMNDPSEGKVLFSYLEIENKEDFKLPEDLPFIACFSLNVNSLNQFRLYGKDNGNEATGVSVLFDASFFSKIYNEDNDYSLYRCVYIDLDDEDEQIKSISCGKDETDEKILEKIGPLFEELKDSIDDLKGEAKKLGFDIKKTIESLLLDIRYLVKHYAFEEEQECRIINIKNKKDKSIECDGNRLYVKAGTIKKHVNKIYFAPHAEGMEAFEIKTGIECIRSSHPFA